jgi:hypothetical protein
MYSTVAELRGNGNNFSLIHSIDLTDIIVTARIVEADKIVEADLSKIIDFSLIVTTPIFINLLSQYKTCEKCLVWLYSRKRKGKEDDDIQYWIDQYKILLEKILDGEVELVDGGGIAIGGTTQIFENDAKPNIEPALGLGEYGGFLNKDDLENIRPIE